MRIIYVSISINDNDQVHFELVDTPVVYNSCAYFDTTSGKWIRFSSGTPFF